MDPKSKFLKIYANLPLVAREEIVVVIDHEPLTWNSAKLEIESNSPRSKDILDMLMKLQIIKHE